MVNSAKHKILLIDDDTSLLVTLSDFLSFENYEVSTAESGEQGLKKLETITPDLIILDMSMPGMGGIGFLKAISSGDGKPKYPVLVLTARANMAEFFANVEVDGFIAKPCEPSDLLMEVGRIIFLRSGAAETERSSASAEKGRVLLGEDEPRAADMLMKAFSVAGYLVDSVSRGPEVLEKAIVGRPDLIVVKLVLANMNGDAVARMLAEMTNTKNIPIIIYDDTDSGVQEAKLAEVNPMIKRFVRTNDPNELTDAAAEVMSDR